MRRHKRDTDALERSPWDEDDEAKEDFHDAEDGEPPGAGKAEKPLEGRRDPLDPEERPDELIDPEEEKDVRESGEEEDAGETLLHGGECRRLPRPCNAGENMGRLERLHFPQHNR